MTPKHWYESMEEWRDRQRAEHLAFLRALGQNYELVQQRFEEDPDWAVKAGVDHLIPARFRPGWFEKTTERYKSRIARGRSRRAGVETDRVSLRDIRDRDGDDCYLCGKHLEVHEMQLEHVIPIAHGGTHTAPNLAISCGSCKQRKRDLIVSFDVSSGRPRYAQPRSGIRG